MFGQSIMFKFISNRDNSRISEYTVDFKKSGCRLTKMVTTGHEIEIEVDGLFTLLIPMSGRIGFRTNLTEVWAEGGVHSLLSRPNRRWSIVDPMGKRSCDALIFQFSKNFAEFEKNNIEKCLASIPDGSTLMMSNPVNNRLIRYLQLLSDEFSPQNALHFTDRFLTGTEILLQECLAEVISNRDIRFVGAVAKAVDYEKAMKARDIIRDRFKEPLRVGQIAADLGMSVRSLQKSFMGVFNHTPRVEINNARLEYIRARLLSPKPNDQVSAVAFESGITHLGRLSNIYREAYGEHPSETLKKHRFNKI